MRFRRALTIAAFFLLILILFMVYSFKDFTDLYNSGKSSIAEDFQEVNQYFALIHTNMSIYLFLILIQNIVISKKIFQNKWLHFENRIRQLESGLNKHHEAVNEIKNAMKIMYNASIVPNVQKPHNNDEVVIAQPKKKVLSGSEMLYNSNCPFQINVAPKSDINMLDVYDRIGFENKDGGVWKQGWKIEVDEREWNRNNILKVLHYDKS